MCFPANFTIFLRTPVFIAPLMAASEYVGI